MLKLLRFLLKMEILDLHKLLILALLVLVVVVEFLHHLEKVAVVEEAVAALLNLQRKKM
jgi:hypothetical protein